MSTAPPGSADRTNARYLESIVELVRGWIEALLHTYDRPGRKLRLQNGELATRYALSARDAVKLLTEAGRPRPAEPWAASPQWTALGREPSPFATLVARCGLDDASARVVAFLLAIEHDASLEALCSYAWDDLKRTRPDVGFAIDLLAGDDEAGRQAVRRALAADAPLRALRIALVGVPGDADVTPPARRLLRLSDRVISALLGDPSRDPLLDGIAELLPSAAPTELILPPPVVGACQRALTPARARVLLHGPAGVGKTLLVRVLATAQERPVLRVSLAELLRAGDRPDRLEELMARVAREAALAQALVVLRAGRLLDDTNHSPAAERLIELADRVAGPVVFSCHVRPSWLVHALPELREVPVPLPPLASRVALWQLGLGGDSGLAPRGAIEEIAGRFVLGGEPIRRAAARSVAQARLRDPAAPKLDVADLAESARLMLQHRLGTVARRVVSSFSWDDLLLPDDTMDGIREMIAFAKNRAFLLDEWGFDRKLPYGRGVSAILAGPPGTGKTMVAQLLAQELGYDLYLIELAQIVNKYVGETEKNLARVFDEAENSQAILFFDEADALFAKRTEVKSSNDRYANLEVNYLLQRMEAYNGVTLLATNLEQGIDEAFKRRVRFSIAFELPEPPVREKLWRSMFPPKARLSPDIDWHRLADRYEMAGAFIKKAALRGASRALGRGPGAEVTHADLELSAQLEYREMGRIA